MKKQLLFICLIAVSLLVMYGTQDSISINGAMMGVLLLLMIGLVLGIVLAPVIIACVVILARLTAPLERMMGPSYRWLYQILFSFPSFSNQLDRSSVSAKIISKRNSR